MVDERCNVRITGKGGADSEGRGRGRSRTKKTMTRRTEKSVHGLVFVVG